MTNQLQQFRHDEFGSIRVIDIKGEPWWVLKDVCSSLGLSSPHKVAERLDEDERNQIPVIDSVGRKQMTAIVNESGLYAVILRSDKPNAKVFRRWITSEVLPSIRKHGAYVTDNQLDNLLRDPELAFELLGKLHSERGKTAALEVHLKKLTPKARYCDIILQCKNAVPVSLIAKDYGMSAVAFNRLLHDFGVQHRVGGAWVLYQRYTGKGYTVSRTYYTGSGYAVMHTCWTQAGRRFLYDLLGYYGILPDVETLD